MTKIYTGNLSLFRNDKRMIDITVKSGIRTFAPTWSMVNDYKQLKCDEKEYTQRYIALMNQNLTRNNRAWQQLAYRKEIILACYCPSNTVFCHRYLLAEILEKMDSRFTVVGELTKNGLIKFPRWIDKLGLWKNGD